MERERLSFFSSGINQFVIRLKDMIGCGSIQESVAQKAMSILNGQSSIDGSPPPAPWSDAAKAQAKSYTWAYQYKDDPRYQDKATPFEVLLEECTLKF